MIPVQNKFKNIFDAYHPKKAVSWFAAHILIKTLLVENRTTKAEDRRKENSSFNLVFSDYYSDHKSEKEHWIDFMADTGDGFNETLTVMYKCISEIETESENEVCPSGKYLIFGGDQVYPFATSEEYANRFLGPFMTVQSLHDDQYNHHEEKKYIHAIPGNHDWYGGLYAFQEVFTNKRKYGNYYAKQPNSYHAIRLSKNTWIWMLDIQLAGNFNAEQVRYFSELVHSEKLKSQKNEKWHIILCIAQPYWFQKAINKEDRLYTVIDNFITQLFINQNPITIQGKEYISKRKLELKLVLTGDIHHYSHFKIKYNKDINVCDDLKKSVPIDDPLTLITAGGGGAYTYPTHHIEDKIINRDIQSTLNNQSFTLKHYYPNATDSFNLISKCIYNIVLKNFSFILFPLFLYLSMFLLVNHYFPPFFTDFREWTSSALLNWGTIFMISSAGFYYLLAVRLDNYFPFIPSDKKPLWWLLVFVTSGLNLLIFILSSLSFYALYPKFQDVVLPLIFGGFLLLMSLINMIFFGYYLYICNIFFRLHDNEVFSVSKINQFKNFLKIKITKEEIVIYPFGIDRINSNLIKSFKNRNWQKLKDDLDNTKVQLIEKPIKIKL